MQQSVLCLAIQNFSLPKRLSFEDATKRIREMVNSITLDRAFDSEKWKDFKFFALVRPEENIFPVRTVYDGRTQNIGSNYLTSEEPIWFAGPDVIAAALQSDKPLQIEKAIRRFWPV
jgi:hypothetical protein